jgi:peptidoglycan hydrolase-like protein with peptidoglycan-binding domain
LRDYGHYLGLVDGVFGDMTEEAVNGFQTNHNIVVDGIVGLKLG